MNQAATIRKPTRPVLRWHGGKWLLAPWIIKHFPPHRVYVEPFGGAASVLIRKPRSYAEVYNDLDDEVVNLFRVIREGHGPQLVEALRMTPYARAEFEAAYEQSTDPVESARNLIVRSFQGHGSDAHISQRNTGWRANSNKSGSTPAHDWVNYPPALALAIERLAGVVVEHRPATECMAQHDTPETLHYVDPPYMPETRSAKAQGNGACKIYAHELTSQDHADLLVFLQTLKGAVVLSGYPAPLYDETLADWHRVERDALADGARERTEVLWINPTAWAALNHGLFGVSHN